MIEILILLLGMLESPQLAVVKTDSLWVFSEVKAEEISAAQYRIVFPDTVGVLTEGDTVYVLGKKSLSNKTEWGFIEYRVDTFHIVEEDTLYVTEFRQGWILLRLKAKYFIEFLEESSKEQNQNIFDFLGGSIFSFLFGQSLEELEEASEIKIDLRVPALIYIGILMFQFAFVCLPFFRIKKKPLLLTLLWIFTTVVVGAANWKDIEFIVGGFK